MFTARQVLEAALSETNKVKAPSLLLKDYNYNINKAIMEYINFKYNYYDLNQQIDDDLNTIRVIDAPITLALPVGALNYRGELPENYLHPLNCSVKYTVANAFGCYSVGDTFHKAASKLTSGSAKRIEENHYFKPSYKNPYFYRNGNNLEIRSGSTTSTIPTTAYIDYLRTPVTINLTQAQLESVIDVSQEMEYEDYVVREIIKVLTKLLLEHSMDPRLQSNIPVNQSIAIPGVQQQAR